MPINNRMDKMCYIHAMDEHFTTSCKQYGSIFKKSLMPRLLLGPIKCEFFKAPQVTRIPARVRTGDAKCGKPKKHS